jgi:hypothetical protein
VGEGQKYRIWAIRSWWLTVVFFVAGVIAS